MCVAKLAAKQVASGKTFDMNNKMQRFMATVGTGYIEKKAKKASANDAYLSKYQSKSDPLSSTIATRALQIRNTPGLQA